MIRGPLLAIGCAMLAGSPGVARIFGARFDAVCAPATRASPASRPAVLAAGGMSGAPHQSVMIRFQTTGMPPVLKALR